MKITVPSTAARNGILRVWLQRIPVDSQIIYAFRTSPNAADAHPISQAHIYGRGEGSSASEKVMLQFPVNPADLPFLAGEVLILKKRSSSTGAYEDVQFDVIEVT
ncbi:hypothetical protein Q4491_13710 [Photobacterium sp. 2_MG-2023]|uniref:hypothetical protein n=1 Tax=Photobacterium sp. 2_MG-2023 TaxID=3062663 RepID=UPI0026E30457|nr:hypothetical protein [Photobacterium sp. 2_MG-2023]MDO6582396.1 hypothetical protein [Photobacterium sp. 2_MG-2023]